jgi:iron complex outermembrane receptor protein
MAEPVARADAPASSPENVTVTATRLGANPFDVAAAITSFPADELTRDALGVNLSDDIAFVPGLLARNRNNYAQDQQVSIRGFGATSTFGVRGIRIYQDGIPFSGPDGQGQVSQFNLESAGRVEVLRGPFSALYGNSSGGVIQLFTAPGAGPTQVQSGFAYGSYGTLRADAGVIGGSGPWGYNFDFTHFQVDGYRPHSSAQNESFNGRVDYHIDDGSSLMVVANIISRPGAQDPLGLMPQGFAADPFSTDPAAIQYDTRKSLQQQQGGVTYHLALSDAQSLTVMAYGGHRTVQQFLAIPASSQRAATSSGGVVDLDRALGGTDVHWSWDTQLAGRHFTWVVGLAYDYQNELRRGYNNFVGSFTAPDYGVLGNLRRDENNISEDFDQYAQGSWDFAPRWSLMAGVRHSRVTFDSQDHFIVLPGNGDDSGSARYEATTPVVGLMYKALQWLHLYADYGQGFQTPIGAELAYRPDGAPGLNLGLHPARNESAEVGAKFDVSPSLHAEATLFQALTNNEIVVATNTGGRATYQNAPRTRRRGLELSLDERISPDWRVQLAYTYLDAIYRIPYKTCFAAPCAAPTVPVAAGNVLPGVPRSDLYAAVRYGRELGWHAAATGQYLTQVAVNDTNTVYAPSYMVVGIEGAYRTDLHHVRLEGFLRLNNLLDRHYVGSVIVDDGNSRFFEPAPGFSVLAGVGASFQ